MGSFKMISKKQKNFNLYLRLPFLPAQFYIVLKLSGIRSLLEVEIR